MSNLHFLVLWFGVKLQRQYRRFHMRSEKIRTDRRSLSGKRAQAGVDEKLSLLLDVSLFFVFCLVDNSIVLFQSLAASIVFCL